MKFENLAKLINQSIELEQQEALEAGRLGFMARALIQATLPHSRPTTNEFERKNGYFNLTILSPSKIGLPYGSIPRLLIVWLTTEAVRTQQREIILGKTLSEFMGKLDLVPTGGRWGTITRLREQMKRLFAASISCTYDDGKTWSIRNVQPISKANLWWEPLKIERKEGFCSKVILGEEFFNEIITNSVPIDIAVLKILKKSPLALDIYCWLTYRMSYLNKTSVINWYNLQIQFGCNYTLNEQGNRNFKKAFLRELRKVNLLYPTAKTRSSVQGLILLPSTPHVKKLK